jgi:LruC domain-containing protein
MMGTDTKTLTITITQPPAPPVITSALTGNTTVNMPYTYEITASGSGPITYNATNLPAGLTFDAGTHKITGSPSSAGTYDITLTATNNPGGTDTKTLVLTVGTPPSITSALTASGAKDEQFSGYVLTATGSSTISYNATGLPAGLSWDADNHSIYGTPLSAGVTNVTLTATNTYGSDLKILVITIIDPPKPPVITSPLTAVGVKNQPFSYTIEATGTQTITYNATGLPPGLTFSGNTISGVPTIVGNTNVTLTATNSVGTDTKTLVINIVFAPGIDTDGDGVPDNLDAYPTDPTRAFNSYYPNQVDFGTFVFEDLWPGYGDYDCNDLVVNFNYTIVTNAQNNVVDLIAKLKIKAAGASLNNGFGFSLATTPANVASVTGCIKLGNSVIIDPNGYEAGHTTSTVIIPFDAVNTLLGRGMVNTIKGGPTVQTELQTVTTHFQTPQASIGTPPFNPFIFINQERGKEVHLKDQPSTELVNPVYFGTANDASNPAQNFYYRSTTGLCWAFEIPVDFQYPVETVDILQTYLHFAEWAQSSGAVYPDWYMDKPGYRNAVNIY